jgi:translation initiation factor 2B subunit (eIF-2B alpha/beta/delta family)
VDRTLRHQLDAIGRDRQSGAAELALRAASAVRTWLRRNRRPREPELLELARDLLGAQPSMASLLRLANEVALAVDARDAASVLRRAATNFQTTLQAGSKKIGGLVRSGLPRKRESILCTYSYSSTVLRAIRAARSKIWWVFCSEGRPGLEGRRTAAEIARMGISVGLTTDAALSLFLECADALVIGADCVCAGGFRNKAGTCALVQAALAARKFVWVLTDTTKFLPGGLSSPMRQTFGATSEIWRLPPRNVFPQNPYFDFTPFDNGIRFATEHGWMTPARVRRELREIQISPRLRALKD